MAKKKNAAAPMPPKDAKPVEPLAPLVSQPPMPAPSLRRSKFDRYDFIEIHRSELIDAPYNPRVITDVAKKKLRRNLEKLGLTHPIVWNRRTKHIVSGHQRIHQIDSLEGTSDYSLRVAVVDLDEKTEKEQNIFENNSTAQGEFDLNKLEELYKIDRLDFEESGFSAAEIYQLFGDSPLVEQPKALEELAQQYRNLRETHERVVKDLAARDDLDFYNVVVFRSGEERQRLTDALGLPDNRYIDGRYLMEKLGISPAAALPPPGTAPANPTTPDHQPPETP